MTDVPRDACQWCSGAIRAGARRDSKFCSKRCRQASHRFHRPSRRAGAARRLPAVAPDGREPRPLRFAYADPPYPGTAARYYAQHPDFGGEVDHAELIRRLSSFDGWALSTSAAALPAVLQLCPPGTRVAAWFRGDRPVLSYSPLSAWEPVLYYGARRHRSPGSARRLDALVYITRPRLADPRRVIGSKPAEFCAWLFKLLGATAGDELTDLFPGSRRVAEAWASFQSTASTRDVSRPALFVWGAHGWEEWRTAVAASSSEPSHMATPPVASAGATDA